MTSSRRIWISRIMSGVITVALLATASMKLAHAPKMVEAFTRTGLGEGAAVPIAIVELTCLALYLIPRTMILGAVLLTGYFGGAIVVHIISGESIFPVFMIGVWVWGGIYFRVPALQNLLPLRRNDARTIAASALSTQQRVSAY